MNILRACLDWRVITGLAALGIGVYVVNPTLLAAAFPLLLIAVCPLSMMLMMRAMGGQQAQSTTSDPAERVEQLRVQLTAARLEGQRLASELESVESSRRALTALPASISAGPRSTATPARDKA